METRGVAPLPTISERLRQLQPSHELLDYYREKISEFDAEQEEMIQKLEKYKATFDSHHQQSWNLSQRDEEVRQLQQALSDMQMYLFQERDHVLRLYAENDRLKIQEFEDRKKIQQLLGLTQPVEEEVTYFREDEDISLVGARGQAAKILSKTKNQNERKLQNIRDLVELRKPEKVESLVLTIEALQAQIEENAKLAKDKEEALLEDRRVREEEFQTELNKEAQKLKEMMEKLHHTQDLLYDSTRDYLELKFNNRAREKSWAEEKQSLLQRIDDLKQDIDGYETEMMNVKAAQECAIGESFQDDKSYRDVGTNVYRGGHESTHGEKSEYSGAVSTKTGYRTATTVTSSSYVSRKQEVADIARLEMQSMAEMYREQCMKLEDELCRLKEERLVSKEMNSDRAKKLLKRLSLMKSRYEQLEQRRQLEAEGYKSSIKLLRKRLSEVEKHLYRLAAEWTSRDSDYDELLRARQRK
eukprot:m.343214 g.343214  ORF g.343214 m.343214 type:complete len:471 (+) comp22528_c0_seq1:246-1658(+)